MFCPICHAEYRTGFTRCADCDVELVNSLSTSDPSENEADQSSDTVRVLWAGVDPRTGDAIAKALDEAGIEHTDDSALSVFLPAMREGIREIRVASSKF